MPKVLVTDKEGLIQKGGEGVELEHGPFYTPRTLTADTAITHPGHYRLSGAAAITVTMPDPAAVPGGVFTFLTVAHSTAHDLTGSRSGKTEFASQNPMDGHGGALALSASTGASVSLMSNGDKYMTMFQSGTLTFSGLAQATN